MKYRLLGKTQLEVSEIGFGAWAIGGPVMAGNIPLGWGNVNDEDSKKAILKSYENGINFFDTADFYGLGHSEEILGEVLNEHWNELIVATKVGHEILPNGQINLNYSKKHIINACEKSLKRLRKEIIDIYQLHSAKIVHLQQGECIEAMDRLIEQGKIRFYGISLNTFNPEAEANFFVENQIGQTFQLVFNAMNQKALSKVIPKAVKNGYGIIARMPLQFGLLTGKFNSNTKFEENDHRNFRLPSNILLEAVNKLQPFFDLEKKYKVPKSVLALSFIMSHTEISTAIPGIKTEAQAEENTSDLIKFHQSDIEFLHDYFKGHLLRIVDEMEKLH
jgi:aryl-alcohol dehydrogenase-like predicted oxidoreductase